MACLCISSATSSNPERKLRRYTHLEFARTCEIVVNRLSPQRTVCIGEVFFAAAGRANGQTPPLRDPYAAPKIFAPLGSNESVVRDGLFSGCNGWGRDTGFEPRALRFHASR